MLSQLYGGSVVVDSQRLWRCTNGQGFWGRLLPPLSWMGPSRCFKIYRRTKTHGQTGTVVNPVPYAGFTVSFSVQRTVAVICITIKSVRIAPMVMDRPVKPSKKKA